MRENVPKRAGRRYPAAMLRTRVLFLALAVAPIALLEACSEDDKPSPTTSGVDASVADSTSTPEASTAEGGADASTTDSAAADTSTATDAGTDAALGYVPCDRPLDAGDAGCPWVKVEVCGPDAALDFHETCGARTPSRALRCNDTVADDLGTQSGPDGSYYNYRVQRCPDDNCATNPQTVVWRCIECCP